MFSCEFYEISKNIFFYRTRLVAASTVLMKFLWYTLPRFYKRKNLVQIKIYEKSVTEIVI